MFKFTGLLAPAKESVNFPMSFTEVAIPGHPALGTQPAEWTSYQFIDSFIDFNSTYMI